MKKEYLEYFKEVPKTGVIYVLERAIKAGYSPSSSEWSNLGQGAPETGPLNGKANDINLSIDQYNREYGPVNGSKSLRKQVAEYYNHLYRKNHSSKYTEDNVCIAGGGRLALSRVVTALGNINLGHFIPDYTAYEELLGMFKTFVPIPILLNSEKKYQLSIKDLENEIVGKGLASLLVSNPCNPTGQVIQGSMLSKWVKTANKFDCLMIFDEFYSHFIYENKQKYISAAKYIEDVNKDPVILINGLSKNWRSPGFRIGWIVGPKDIIEKVSSVGSFLDGGPMHPIQEEAIKIIKPEKTKKDTALIQEVFNEKRKLMLSKLKNLNFVIENDPSSTFYVWANLKKLPEPLNNALNFFEECLKEKVITVPGIFFDVNPGKRRLLKHSRYLNYVRLSFGPSLESVTNGLNNIEKVIKKYS
tara:strand:+ start:502 stop:1749 length:1248 start_codon:yes stop_codon:yes gene_type:complete